MTLAQDEHQVTGLGSLDRPGDGLPPVQLHKMRCFLGDTGHDRGGNASAAGVMRVRRNVAGALGVWALTAVTQSRSSSTGTTQER